MRLRFLCEEHRQRLKADPEAARDLWLETAVRLSNPDGGPTPHEVSLAGSALEASHLYLADMTLCPRSLIERYAFTALHLIDLMQRLGQSQPGIVVVAVATAMLEQLRSRGASEEACRQACFQVTAAGRRLLEAESSRWGLCATLVHHREFRATIH